MKTAVVAGIVLGALCVAWTFLMGFTGWYLDPTLLNLFWLVIAFEIAILIVLLQKTARQGFGYGRQVAAALVMGLVAGAIVFAGSYVFTTVAFPNYFADIQRVQEDMLRRSGTSEADLARTMDAARAGYTPVAQALAGFMGTVITALVGGAVIAIWTRAKKPAAG